MYCLTTHGKISLVNWFNIYRSAALSKYTSRYEQSIFIMYDIGTFYIFHLNPYLDRDLFPICKSMKYWGDESFIHGMVSSPVFSPYLCRKIRQIFGYCPITVLLVDLYSNYALESFNFELTARGLYLLKKTGPMVLTDQSYIIKELSTIIKKVHHLKSRKPKFRKYKKMVAKLFCNIILDRDKIRHNPRFIRDYNNIIKGYISNPRARRLI